MYFSPNIILIIKYVLLAKYYSGNQIQKVEMGGACGTYMVKEKYIRGCGREA
jgi:hypothetical protein